MSMRVNEPPSLNKGDPNKFSGCEMIESVTYGELDDFDKRSRRSYVIEGSDFNKLDFLVNHLMFSFAQFKHAWNAEEF